MVEKILPSYKFGYMEDIYSALQNPLKKPETQTQSKHTGIYEESLKLGE